MKLLAILFAALATAALAAPAECAPDVLARDGIDCSRCIGLYDFCVKNGHTKGQEGCMVTCREHVCHRHRECKQCGNPFDKCPENSRYNN
ncbi:hypothetical protein IQ07DRAFT_682365 [Pyrenochaeta sp. DS3sAY3a]|nr:hypothetical protein IQ07DRAFT_682365 [Pyrenochaeta sp. DS3sAY3a]